MLVRFKYAWFAPTEPETRESRQMSGQYFSPGVHEIEEEYRSSLPSSVEILDELPELEDEDEIVETLRDHDMDRVAGFALAEEEQKANQEVAKINLKQKKRPGRPRKQEK
jgi:hypothetical protein|tara:strand:- start:5651 stop:5980 length:330 start_codon:yes stop_codon:yes gene_type:complete